MSAVYTVTELKNDTDNILAMITSSGRPAAITRHGRFVAIVVPITDAEVMHAALTRGPIAEELARRTAALDSEETFTSDQVADELRKRHG